MGSQPNGRSGEWDPSFACGVSSDRIRRTGDAGGEHDCPAADEPRDGWHEQVKRFLARGPAILRARSWDGMGWDGMGRDGVD